MRIRIENNLPGDDNGTRVGRETQQEGRPCHLNIDLDVSSGFLFE